MTVATRPVGSSASRFFARRPSRAAEAPAGPGGVWTFEGDELVRLAPSDVGDATVLVPSGDLLLVVVDLPLRSRRERVAALPFALEDRLAEPLGEVHTALGMELAPNRHLAAAVRHPVMARWVEKALDAGLRHCTMLPDALGLPVPEPGGWSVQTARGRALVRAADGTGFAAPLAALPALWEAAERPACVSYGDPLPPEIPAVPAELALEPLTTRLLVPALDLRQGLYAPPRRAAPASARRIGAILLAGALVHGAVAVADTLALERIAERRRAEAQELAQRFLPGTTVDEAFAAEVDALLAGAGPAPGGAFLPKLVRASTALSTAASGAALQGIGYDAAQGALSFDLADPASASRLGAALAADGLPAAGGAGTRVVVRTEPAR